MARDFPNDVNQYLDGGNVADVQGFFTLHCWIQIDTATIERKIMAKWASGGTNQQYLFETNGTPHVVRLLTRDVVGSSTVTGGTTLSTGVWYAIGGRVKGTGGADQQVFLNGSSDGSGTGKNPWNTGQAFKIGRDGAGNPFDGRICDAAVWNTNLSDSEMAILAKGVCPLNVRRSSLVGYWPIFGVGSPEADLSGNGANLTVNGALSQAAHAPVGRLAQVKSLQVQQGVIIPLRVPIPVVTSAGGRW